MKALLMKDLYMAKKYCWSYAIIVVAFLAAAMAGSSSNLLFLAYPCLMTGMIPTTLLAYDERLGWTTYSGCLPYTKTQLVGEKYLLGLLFELVVLALTLGCFVLSQGRSGGVDARALFGLGLLLFAAALLPGAVQLPAMLLLGTERGRIACMGILALLLVGSMALSPQSVSGVQSTPGGTLRLPILAGLAAAAILLYALSFLFSRSRYPGKLKD